MAIERNHHVPTQYHYISICNFQLTVTLLLSQPRVIPSFRLYLIFICNQYCINYLSNNQFVNQFMNASITLKLAWHFVHCDKNCINIKIELFDKDLICDWLPLALSITVFTSRPSLIKTTSDYFSAKSKLHQEHLQVIENICKRNCYTVKLFKQST